MQERVCKRACKRELTNLNAQLKLVDGAMNVIDVRDHGLSNISRPICQHGMATLFFNPVFLADSKEFVENVETSVRFRERYSSQDEVSFGEILGEEVTCRRKTFFVQAIK